MAIGPLIEQLARKYPNVTFLKVDVDKCPGASQSAGVSAMPTLKAFHGGREIGERRDGDRFVHGVDRVDLGGVDPHEAGRAGE